MKSRYLHILAGALALVFSSHGAFAAAIAVSDSDFEANTAVAAAGDWSNDLGAWQETGGPSNANAFIEYIVGFSADGVKHVGVNSTHDIWQDLSVTFQANTLYTLDVAVGNRAGQSGAGNLSTYSLFDATGASWATANYDAFANVGAGTFADAPSLTFDTSLNPGAVGQTIRIQLEGEGPGRSHFDNIRLDAAPIPEPSGFALLGLGGLLLMRRRR